MRGLASFLVSFSSPGSSGSIPISRAISGCCSTSLASRPFCLSVIGAAVAVAGFVFFAASSPLFSVASSRRKRRRSWGRSRAWICFLSHWRLISVSVFWAARTMPPTTIFRRVSSLRSAAVSLVWRERRRSRIRLSAASALAARSSRSCLSFAIEQLSVAAALRLRVPESYSYLYLVCRPNSRRSHSEHGSALMPTSQTEIRERITSNDLDVLRQSLAFASACLADERDRSKTAETRAAAMLAVLGVIAGLVVPQAATLGGAVDMGTNLFLLVGYIAPLLFILRGLVYAVRVLSVSRRFRNTPELLFALQEHSQPEALRVEIAAVVWEYRQTVQPTTTKLHWLYRCQLNGLAALILLAIFAVAVVVGRQEWFEMPPCVTLVFGVLVAVVFASEGLVAQRGIWSKRV